MYKFHKLLLTSAFSRFLTSVRSIYSFNTRLAPKSSFALPKSRTIDEHLKLSSLYLLKKYWRISTLTFILPPAAPMDNMKRILCSDWLSERARLVHLTRSELPALIA